MSNESPHAPRIAIVGMSCRLPGAANVDRFWANLCAGVESIRRLSRDEMLDAGIDPKDFDNPRHVPVGALMEDVDRFDAPFFGVTAREAELMDPQQRVFLECAWEALEHAGCDPGRFDGAIGVFGGANFDNYLTRNLIDSGVFEDKAAILQAILANDKDYLATRVSYKLNLRGPAYAVQSGCSTSLVAVHLATHSLLNYECDMALAGGVAIDASRAQGYWAHEGSVFSPDGHVRAFGAGAQGTVFGNGAAIVVLKRLEDAVLDGNLIYGVILGSAVNNDGSAKVGFTAPSVMGQSEVIAEALADAGVSPQSIGYVEAHGTGTPLGDPIEVEALTKAFGGRSTGAPCAIGAVKANVGHLDSAAGAVGLIKTALALRHGMLPPSLHAAQSNPAIAFDRTPFRVNSSLVPWTAGSLPGLPRRAGVSSFGMGGTNAHLVLEEALTPPGDPAPRAAQLLVWSARTPEALERATEQLAAVLRTQPADALADVAHTLQVGRAVFAHRRALACASVDDAVAALATPGSPRVRSHVHSGTNARVAFLLPGQGSQYPNMGRALYESEPVFRREIDACAADLAADAGVDLVALLYPRGGDSVDDAAARLAQTELTQPALFAVEYATACLWRSWGVEPTALLGHSLGEYVAACLAGVFSRSDALRIVTRRGQLMQEVPEGAMTAVGLAADAIELTGSLALAADNAPAMAVVAGPPDEIERFEQTLAARGVEHRRLRTTRAFHSPMVDAVMEPFTRVFAGIRLSAPSIPVVSNVTGRWLEAEEATNPGYWAEHLRRTVRFSTGLECLMEGQPTHLVEVGPGRTLATLARQRKGAAQVVTSLPGADVPTSADAWALDALGQLWQGGVGVEWAGVHAGQRRLRVPLPTYPFERIRYWIEAQSDEDETPTKLAARKMPDPADWIYLPQWEQTAPVELLGRRLEAAAEARWLVLAGDDPLAHRIVERLQRAAPGRVTVASAGRAFGVEGERRFSIDPRSADDYPRLLSTLDSTGDYPDVVVHLWALAPAANAADAAAVIAAQDLGLFSLLLLARALEPDRAVTVRVVTAGGQDVTGTEELVPGASTLFAAARVLPQEQPHVVTACVDVDAGEARDIERVDRLSARIEAELLRGAPEPFVSYRGGSRWIQAFPSLSLQPAGPADRWRTRGTYVVLGGLGRIGLSLASHLAATAQARVVLVGRTGLPPRADWATWLGSHVETDRVSQRIRAVQGIERLGGDVRIVVADAANAGDLERAFAEAEQAFGPVDGVIAAAGIIDAAAFAPMASLSAAECVRQFRPKLDGLFALDEVLRRRTVGLCVITSSLSSVLGGLGYGAYGAANAFMDAFARLRNRQGHTRWLAVNWDAWRWTDAGQDVPGAALARLAMSASEAADVFDRLPSAAAAGLSQVVVSTSQLAARLSLWVNYVGARAAFLDEPKADASVQATPSVEPMVGPRTETSAASAPAVAVAAAEPDLTPTQQAIVEAWRKVLGIKYVELHDSFLDLGGSSLTAVQVISRIEQALGVRIAIEEFIFQTAGQLATLCDQKMHAASATPVAAPPGEPVAAQGGGLLRSLRSAITGGRP